MPIFQPGLREWLDFVQVTNRTFWNLPPQHATKDAHYRNSIIADRLSELGLMELDVSHTAFGDDATDLLTGEPVELKSHLDPKRKGRRTTKIDFHKGSIKHHEQMARSKVVVGIFESYEHSGKLLERLAEIWVIEINSPWHAEVLKKIERMKQTGKKSSSLSLSISRLPRVARRLI